jgi:hypothetical protein
VVDVGNDAKIAYIFHGLFIVSANKGTIFLAYQEILNDRIDLFPKITIFVEKWKRNELFGL